MDWIESPLFALLLRLVASHLAVELVWNMDAVASRLRTRTRQPVAWVLHGLLAWATACVFAWRWEVWWLFSVVALVHVASDWCLSGKQGRTSLAVRDHLGHVAVLALIWLLLIGEARGQVVQVLGVLFRDSALWALLLAYAVVFWPAGHLVGALTERWRAAMADEEDSDGGLVNGGLWIGRLERVLIVSFILFGHFEAIGFLFAAKSILRYGELSKGAHRRMAEYILIGSMLSFLIAIVVGMAASYAIGA